MHSELQVSKNMTITGQNLIAGEWSGKTEGGFKAFNAQTHKAIDIEFSDATELEVNTAIVRANEAFATYGQLSAQKRATFLRTIGEEILALGDELVEAACGETGLQAMRIQVSVAERLVNLIFLLTY